MADTDRSEWRLLDTNLTTVRAILPVTTSHFYYILNETGSGGLTIPLSAPSASVISSGMYAQYSYRGAVRGGFFIENIQKENAPASEGGGQWLSISGRGSMALLDDAVVWTDGTTDTTRKFDAKTKAYILKTFIDEAQARGGLSVLSYDFTATDDSDAVAWTDSEDYSFAVGTSLLEVLRQFAETGIDFEMNYSAGEFVLSAYKNGIGTDKSETVYMRVGTNCEEVTQDERGNEIKNAYILPYKNGTVLSTDATSITAYRRREKMLDARVAQSAASASTYGAAVLDGTKDPQQGKIVKVYDGVNPRAFVDYIVGDYVTLDIQGVEASYRILGLQCDVDGDQYSNVVVELNSLLLTQSIKREQDLNFLLKQWNTARDADLLEVTYWAQIGNPDNDGPVYCTLAVGDNIYVGGSFTRIGGIPAANIAMYNTVTGNWTALSTGLGTGGVDFVNALTMYGTDIIAGGFFTSPHKHIAKWDGAAWSALDTGLSEEVTCFAQHDGDLYVGGWFLETYGGAISMYRLARWDGAAWTPLFGSGSGCAGPVACLAVIGDVLYVGSDERGWRDSGGTLYTSWGLFKFNIATNTFSAVTHAVGTGVGAYDILGNPNDGIHEDGYFHGPRALVADGTDLYVGGEFINVGGIDAFGDYIGGGLLANYIAKWDTDADVWSTLGNGFDYDCHALAFDSGVLYAGGIFTTADGVSVNGIARYSGGIWLALGVEGITGVANTTEVNAISLHDTDVYIGGAFTRAGSLACKYFSAYITDFQSMLESLSNSSAASAADIAAAIHNAPEQVVSDADEFGFWEDTAAALRKITWANIKATLVTYFDTLYLSLTQTANRIIISNGAGLVTTDSDLQWDTSVNTLKITGAGDYAIIEGVSDGATSYGLWAKGGDGSAAGVVGGDVELDGGAGNTTGAGGNVYVYGGEGGASGDGGLVGIYGGFGGATTGAAGNVEIFAGGVNDGNGNGGNVTIGAGDGAGAGVNGQVEIRRAKFTDTPAIQYIDTKANIEALTTASEGAIAYATDTDELGIYDGVAWSWLGSVSAPLFLDGTSDVIQLRVQGHSTQTADIVTHETSAGVVRSGADSRGILFSTSAGGGSSLFLGLEAGNVAESVGANVCIGYQAGFHITTGTQNYLLGFQNGASLLGGSYNLAIGSQAFKSNVNGTLNIALGFESQKLNTLGDSNISIGNRTLYNNRGTLNIAIGEQAMASSTAQTGNENIALGYASLFTMNGAGNSNTAIGSATGSSTVGSNNTFLGYWAGAYATGSDRLIIDSRNRGGAAAELTDAIIVGTMAATPAAQSLSLNAVVKTGGRRRAYVAKTANYTITVADEIVNCTSGTFTITLPTAVSAEGQVYDVKNSGTGVITFATTSSQTIDGNASGTLTRAQYESYTLASDGANWIIL